LTFYDRLAKIDINWELLLEPLKWAFCQDNGRPTDPVVYGKCFLVGYFEDIECDTDLAARVSDSLSIRRFLFGSLAGSPPDHSSLSRVRRIISERCDLNEMLAGTTDLMKCKGMVIDDVVAMDTSLVPSRARRCFADVPTPTKSPEAAPGSSPTEDGLGVAPAIVAELSSPSSSPPEPESASDADVPTPTKSPEAASESNPSEPAPVEISSQAGEGAAPEVIAELSSPPPEPVAASDADEMMEKPANKKDKGPNRRLVPSAYDPEAHISQKPGFTPGPSYKISLAVDYKNRVILAADAHTSSTSEGQAMRALYSDLVRTTGLTPDAVADKGMDDAGFHATVEFFGATPVTALKKNSSIASGLGKERFFYDQARDLYLCPAGQELHRKLGPDSLRPTYVASKPVCDACPLKIICWGTRTTPKSINRTFDEDSRDRVVAAKNDPANRKLLAYRKAIVEPVFADFKECGGLNEIWTKGLRCVQTKVKMAAVGWNIRILMKHIEAEGQSPRSRPRPKKPVGGPKPADRGLVSTIRNVFGLVKHFNITLTSYILLTYNYSAGHRGF
jgi:hypothetical protein